MTDQPPDWSGQRVGAYTLIEKIARGGMGVVYRARREPDGQAAAVKLIVQPRHNEETAALRFTAEMQALKRIAHPGIVPLLEAGEQGGTPYLVMPYYSGTLKERTGAPLPYREAAGLLAPVARALAAVHGLGIVHRDIKPSNLLRSADGAYLVADFGIARQVIQEETSDGLEARPGAGTPEYMAPEQALGQEVDGRADIYSLGAIFYQLVTGRLPYEAESTLGLYWKQAAEPVARPGIYAPGLPAAAERVILKALEKEPGRRFASMADFARHLEWLASGELGKIRLAGSPPARGSGAFASVNGVRTPGQPVRRPHAGVYAAVLLTAALLLAVAVLAWRNQAPVSAPGRAPAEAAPPVGAVEADPTRAGQAAPVSEPTVGPPAQPAVRVTPAASVTPPASQAEATLTPTRRAEKIGPANAARLQVVEQREPAAGQEIEALIPLAGGVVWGAGKQDAVLYLWNLGDPAASRVIRATNNYFSSIAVDPSFTVAAAGWHYSGGGMFTDRFAIRVWKLANDSLWRSLAGHTADITSLAIDPGGRRLVSGSADQTVRLWDLETAQALASVSLSSPPARVAVSPDLERYAAADQTGAVRVWQGAGYRQAAVISAGQPVEDLVFSPDGNLLAVATGKAVLVWDAGKNSVTATFDWGAVSLAFAPQGDLLAAASGGPGRLRLVSPVDGVEIWTHDLEGEPVQAAFAPDGLRLYASEPDGRLTGWGIEP